MDLDKKIARRWVKALLSGKYKQGRGALKLDGRFCCLGVLCDISKAGKWNNGIYVCGKDEDDESDINVPITLADQVGLPYNTQSELIDMNDGSGDHCGTKRTFRTIAKRICKEAGIEMPEVAKK
jgi:hypothetical protein